MMCLKQNDHFVAIGSALKLGTLILLFSGINSISVAAQTAKAKSVRATEQWVQQQVRKGEDADLSTRTEREISADFLAKLIRTFSQQRNLPSNGIRIANAIISGDLNLDTVEVPFELRLEACDFQGAANFYQSEFRKSLSIEGSTFERSLGLQRTTIAGNLWAGTIQIKNSSTENPAVNLANLKVGDTFVLSKAIFDRGGTFFRMNIGGDFFADETRFTHKDEEVNFDGIKVNGTVVFDKAEFDSPFIISNLVTTQLECVGTKFRNQNENFYAIKLTGYASFADATFDGLANFESIDIAKDFDATRAHFNSRFDPVDFFSMKVGGNAIFQGAEFASGFTFAKADIGGNLDFGFAKASAPHSAKAFSGMKADTAIFDNADLTPPYYLNGVTYRLISETSAEGLKRLIEKSEYSPDAYLNLEGYLRRMGMQDAADEVYVAGRVRERDERFRAHHFAYFPEYLWSWILYISVGYGKHLSRALLWSILLIGWGYWLFRKEDFMEVQTKGDEERYKGRYHPLWYSIALFLPVVELEDARIWAPKADRKWRRFYMRLHMILGFLLIPIGLAAWTGLIK